MKKGKNRQILGNLGLITICILVLAGGLPYLEFKPAEPFILTKSESQVTPTQPFPVPPETRLLLKFPLAFVFILGTLLLIFYLFKNIQYKKFLIIIGTLLLIAGLFFLIDKIQLPEAPAKTITQQPRVAETAFKIESPPPGVPENTQLFSILLIGTAGLVFIIILISFYKSSRPQKVKKLLADEADQALKAIRNGQNVGDIIIYCYLQMEQILKDEKGIQRNESVTPREFEGLLAANNVPTGQIHQLTQLFEKARYSNKKSGLDEKRMAEDCLSSIIRSCSPKYQGNL